MKLYNKNDLEKIEYLHVMVDLIDGFMKEGALADKDMMRIVPEVVRLAEMFEEHPTGTNAYGEDWHPKNAREFNVYGAHAIENTKETETIDELKPYKDGGLTYKKNSTNLVLAKNFINDIEKMGNLKVVVTSGVLAEECIKKFVLTLNDYFDEKNRDVVIIVPTSAIDTFNAPNHPRKEIIENATKDMENHGIKIVKKLGGI